MTTNIILLGDNASGKSLLLHRFVHQQFVHGYPATIGIDYDEVTVPLEADEDPVRIRVWDTAGHERFRPLFRNHYRMMHGAILVYDLTDPASLSRGAAWLSDFEQYWKEQCPPLLLVGTKSDLEEQREMPTEAGEHFARDHHMQFREVSALTGEKVEEAFLAIIREAVQHSRERHSRASAPPTPPPERLPADERPEPSPLRLSSSP